MWLKTRLRLYSDNQEMAQQIHVDDHSISTYGPTRRRQDGKLVSDTAPFIYAKDITDVAYKFVSDEGYYLIISGETSIITADDDDKPERHSHDITLLLNKETSKEDVERVVKAVKHLATLAGAKLPSDDLFK